MKYPFTNATLAERRKGKEVLAPTHTNHPMRETVIISPDAHVAPTPKPKMMKAGLMMESQEDRIRKEVERILTQSKKKTVPKSRILSLATAEADNTKEINDVLTMLMAKK